MKSMDPGNGLESLQMLGFQVEADLRMPQALHNRRLAVLSTSNVISSHKAKIGYLEP